MRMIDMLLEIVADMDNNAITKYCVAQHPYANIQEANWREISGCAADLRYAKKTVDEDELRAFLKKYPHYKYPGQALPNFVVKPLDRCWGKNRKCHRDVHC